METTDYSEFFDENWVFSMTFGTEEASVSCHVEILPDENEDIPEVRVNPLRGLTRSECKELESVIQDLVEDYYSDDFDSVKLVKEIKNWLYWRSEDPEFRDLETEKKEEQIKKFEQEKKIQNQNQKTVEKSPNQNNPKSNEGNPINNPAPKTADEVAKQKFAEKLKRMSSHQKNILKERLKREVNNSRLVAAIGRQTSLLEKGEYILYVSRGLTPPDAQVYGGEQTGFLMENIAIGVAEEWIRFTHTYHNIKAIPSIIGQLNKVQELNLAYNELTTIPPEVNQMVSLRKLILPNNKIKFLPYLGSLENLSFIDLRHNQLESIDNIGIGNLTNLSSLDLQYNSLRELPLDIGECTKLTYLNLDQNKISLVPPEVGLLPLEYFKLRNNPITMIPSDIYHQGVQSVLQYLKQYVPEHSDYFAASKINANISSNLGKKLYSDIVLQVNNTQFYCHNIILRSRCNLFYSTIIDPELQRIKLQKQKIGELKKNQMESTLYQDHTEDEEGRPIVHVSKYSPETFQIFLSYLYGIDPIIPEEWRDDAVTPTLTEEDYNTQFKIYENIETIADEFQIERLAYLANLKKIKIKLSHFTELNKNLGSQIATVKNKIAIFPESGPAPMLQMLLLENTNLTKLRDDIIHQLPQLTLDFDKKKNTIPRSTLGDDLSKALFSSDFSDLTFMIEGQLIYAHKVIICSRSDYFGSMFSIGLKEAKQKVIELSDVRYDVFKAVLEYLYTEEVEDINGDIAMDLLVASGLYSLERLKTVVESLVGYSLDIENVACIFDVAWTYNCIRLQRSCLYFGLRNFAQLKKTQGWKDMIPKAKDYFLKKAQDWNIQ